MAKKYRINPETLQLERIEHGFQHIVHIRLLRRNNHSITA